MCLIEHLLLSCVTLSPFLTHVSLSPFLNLYVSLSFFVPHMSHGVSSTPICHTKSPTSLSHRAPPLFICHTELLPQICLTLRPSPHSLVTVCPLHYCYSLRSPSPLCVTLSPSCQACATLIHSPIRRIEPLPDHVSPSPFFYLCTSLRLPSHVTWSPSSTHVSH